MGELLVLKDWERNSGQWKEDKESHDSLEDLAQRGIDRELHGITEETSNRSAISVDANGNSDNLDLVHETKEPAIGIDGGEIKTGIWRSRWSAKRRFREGAGPLHVAQFKFLL